MLNTHLPSHLFDCYDIFQEEERLRKLEEEARRRREEDEEKYRDAEKIKDVSIATFACGRGVFLVVGLPSQ